MLQNKEVLDRAAGLPGHSLNLRHDILPGTPVEHVKAAVQIVHERTAAGLGKAA
jgi:uroporphyrinogen decarboxylase